MGCITLQEIFLPFIAVRTHSGPPLAGQGREGKCSGDTAVVGGEEIMKCIVCQQLIT